jgi:quercetin dioxygenase-like cupin family protein
VLAGVCHSCPETGLIYT